MNAIAGVEDVDTILDFGQQRYMARCLDDPSTSREIWDEAMRSKSGRPWRAREKDTWVNPKGQKRSDGYETVARRLLGTLDTSNTTRISWRQEVGKYDLQEVDSNLTAEDNARRCEHAIKQVEAVPIYTEGSQAEDGKLEGGYYLSEGELGVSVGKVATVWDGKVAGLERGIQVVGNREWKIILLIDSKFFSFFFISLLACGLDHGETPGPPVRGACSYGPEIGTKKDYGQKGKTKEKNKRKV